MALMLAMVGLWSSVAYAVSQRTQEFAVLLALGARPASLVTPILGDRLRGALVATVAGLTIAGWASRFIAALLYGVSPHEPMVFLGVATAILAVSALASLLPAWRVSRIDPAAALRAE